MESSRYRNSWGRHFFLLPASWQILIIVPAVIVLASSTMRAQCGGGGCTENRSGCGQHSSSNHGAGSDHQSHAYHEMQGHGGGADGTLARRPREAPHGGQVATAEWQHFETVFTPKETRVYVYSLSLQRMDAQDVRGEVVMQVRGNPRLFRYAVQEAEEGPGMRYLSVPVDLRGIRDGDMLVTFALDNLPFREEPTVHFSHIFALTPATGATAGPQAAASQAADGAVRVVPLTDADRPLIARQRTCPVLGSALGDHGDPVKVLVDGKPLFICCSGCLDKVKENPDLYLGKIARHVPGS